MTESKNLEYLSKVFEGLSMERKDYVLNTARSLLKIQDDNTRTIPVNKPVLPDVFKEFN